MWLFTQNKRNSLHRAKCYYTILYYTILYYTILYYTILYYTILYYTIYYTDRSLSADRSVLTATANDNDDR